MPWAIRDCECASQPTINWTMVKARFRAADIQVARLAGLPAAVIARAREVLERLEDQELNRPGDALIDDLPLFSVARSVPVEKAGKSAALMRLDTIEPDELAPRQALEALYELKAIRSDERDGD